MAIQSGLLLVASITGLLLEFCCFSRNEWDRRSPSIVFSFLAAFFVTFVVSSYAHGTSFTQAFLQTVIYGCTLLASLSSSIIVYRLFLHPLKFPGPFGARVTALWVVKESIPDLKFYVKLRSLHDTYGDFVRIRPREVSVCHPDAIIDVHGSRNNVRKGEFYDQNYPYKSIELTRDVSYHKAQRKYWDKIFQSKALHEYSPCLTKHFRTLLDIFDGHAMESRHIDASHTFMDLFFDIVSELTFGESFDALSKKQRNPIIGEFLERQKIVGFLLQLMWSFYLIRCLPFVESRIQDFMSWYAAALKKRSKMLDAPIDFYTQLSQSPGFAVNGVYEAQVAIIAGADTNAVTVSNACYLLCQYPEFQAKLYSELASLCDQNGIIEDRYLTDKPNLIGLINETLRLFPPVPGGLQRLTPPEGGTVVGQFIPGNMVISTPTYSLHRDHRAFVQPNEFVPERWSSMPELILRKDAFVPFGYGTYGCAGKPLAMMQLRMVIAMLVKRYQMKFPIGKEAECRQFIEDQADCFTLHLDPLPLEFLRRGE